MLDYGTRQLIEHTLLVFAALFPIVNPVGGAPVFLAMTRGLDDGQRRHLASRIAINAFLLVMGSIFVGNYVIGFSGCRCRSSRSAAGCWYARSPGGCCIQTRWRTRSASGPRSSEEMAARAFYPMPLPLTAGPGSISVAITLGAQAPRGATAWVVSIGAFALGAFLLALTIWVLYRYAERLTRALGATGTQVLLRLSAFILLCIGVQIVWNGVFALIATIPSFRPR